MVWPTTWTPAKFAEDGGRFAGFNASAGDIAAEDMPCMTWAPSA